MASVTGPASWAQLDFKCQEMACNKKVPKVGLPKLACLSKQDVVDTASSQTDKKCVFHVGTYFIISFSLKHTEASVSWIRGLHVEVMAT